MQPKVTSSVRDAKIHSSVFKSKVERLPDITGRHSSMAKFTPGPGQYETI